MRELENSSLSNQDISSFLLVHTYTASIDRAILVRIHVDQIQGNGDYQVYATIQPGGAGSEFMEGGITTIIVPSGQTAIGFPAVLLPVFSGDVVKFYVKGLAADTATPDIETRIIELDYLRPTTAGRTLDVSATGEAGLDFSNIKDAAAPHTLAEITVPTVTTLTNSPDVPSADEIAGAVLDEAKGVHAGFLTTVAIPGNKMDLVDVLKNKVGETGYDRTTDSLEALGDKTAGASAADVDNLLTTNHGAGAWGGGGNGGTLSLTYTAYKPDGITPAEGAIVRLYSDSGRTALITTKVANVLGQVVFTNLVAGTYYLRSQLSPYPDLDDSEVVS